MALLVLGVLLFAAVHFIPSLAPGWPTELANLAIAAVALAIVVLLHPWLAGVPVRW